MSRHLLACAAFVAISGAAHAAALGTPTPATAIYQQRDAEGRIVLTDRPSPTTVVERAWRVDPEDAVAARQRSIDMKMEAQAVSDRIRQRLEAQQRRVDDEALRDQLARAELEQRRAVDLSRDDDRYVESGVIYTPYGVRQGSRWRPHRDGRDFRDARDFRAGGAGRGGSDAAPRGPRPPRLRGSEAPESR